MMDFLLTTLTVLGTALVAFVTFLPMTGSHRWWIRGWDFPRLQIAVVALAFLALAIWTGGAFGWACAAILAICSAYQFYRIYPFTPLGRKDFEFASQREDDISAVAINVEMDNDRFDLVRDVIEKRDPDILLLMETDETWIGELDDILSRYPTVHREPMDNYYGLAFATRLKTHSLSTRQLTREKTPTLFAELEDKNGNAFRFVGLHPKPPVPGVDTEERDMQILYAARFARDSELPVVVMGDFNDAAWSDTAERFKNYGEYLDVRAGRGLLPSFHARHWWFRCPIDQLYVTAGVVVSYFQMGKYVGSDHFPVEAQLRFDDEESRLMQRRDAVLDDITRMQHEGRMAVYRATLEKVSRTE